jgi:hypothetical protein
MTAFETSLTLGIGGCPVGVDELLGYSGVHDGWMLMVAWMDVELQ